MQYTLMILRDTLLEIETVEKVLMILKYRAVFYLNENENKNSFFFGDYSIWNNDNCSVHFDK